MFQTYRARGICQTAILFGTIAIQFATFAHGHPTVTGNELVAEQARSLSDSLDLDSRQTIPIPPALEKFPSGPLNQFLKIISTLPAGEAGLDASALILTPLQQGLADSAGIQTRRSDLERSAPCADVTVVFARGTTEPGNVGLVTGPPFFDALKQQLGSKTLAVQGVEYPASFAGFNRNGVDGVPSMTMYINRAFSRCPNTKVVMSGYSQGALVVRSTANSLPAATMAKINSIVTFGDPKNPAAITGGAGKTLIVCHPNDAVCKGGFINVDHLTYGDDAGAAAQFVVSKVNGQ